jgi:GNAT superfamily N-acetyltransferase
METISITAVQSEDSDELRAFMSRVVVTSVTMDQALLPGAIGNVLKNLAWAEENASLCCHLKCTTMQNDIVGVVLVKNFWNLCSLFVAPELHRHGIGRALVLAATAACRGKSEKNAIWLNAAPNAVPFYFAAGFAQRSTEQVLPSGVVPMELGL